MRVKGEVREGMEGEMRVKGEVREGMEGEMRVEGEVREGVGDSVMCYNDLLKWTLILTKSAWLTST